MAYHRGTTARGAVVNRTVEQVRRAMPVNQYLYLLHRAGTTGYMPQLDEHGEPLPIADDTPVLSPQQRTPILQYLLDKIMPDAKYDHEPDALEAQAVRVDEIPQLRSEQLARLLAPTPPQFDPLPIRQATPA